MFLRVIIIAILVATLTVYFMYTLTEQQHTPKENKIKLKKTARRVSDSNYLIRSSKCNIPNLKPFNKDTDGLKMISLYQNCSNLPLLSYITIENNLATLYINESIKNLYSYSNVSCCYNYIERASNSSDPDNNVESTPCVTFRHSVQCSNNIIFVKCIESNTKRIIYKNIHAPITVKQNLQPQSKSNNHLSVLCIGIDSVSRLHLIRTLPITYAYLQKNRWISLEGYNKVGDNTFPNLMAILTGMNESTAYEICNPKKVGGLDMCKMLWYDYQNLGFVTAYAEDETKISTFNFLKKGFLHSPTDYYFRPYLMSTEKLLKIEKIDGLNYCTGPETAAERMFDLIKGFTNAFAKYCYFGFFWMNSFSHNSFGAVSRMDSKIEQLLSQLQKSSVLDNTIVFFYSDHGLRVGSIRHTNTGWLEERLPFFFVHLPKWFKDTYPIQSNNLKLNSYKLTTPYDFYMTLQDILMISKKNYSATPSSGCPKCQSLFSDISYDRSCEEAGINQHWCTCQGFKKYSENHISVKLGIKFVIRQIHETIQSYKQDSKKCAKFKLHKVISSSISENYVRNETYLLLMIKVRPPTVFEATVSVKKNSTYNFRLLGTVSRLDYYESHSKCVNDGYLKKYCYCR